jgi:hypothetical protein
VPSAAHDAEAASAVAINREIERIDRWTVKPLADATQRKRDGKVLLHSNCRRLVRYCSLPHESFQRRKSSNCSNGVKLSVSLRLGHHFKHGLTIDLASIGKKRLNGRDEGVMFRRRECVDLATFRFDRLARLFVLFNRKLALIGDRFVHRCLHGALQILRPAFEGRPMQENRP